MPKPLVSVICLCYNHRKYVRDAVESVISQNYPAIEIILADDASTDDSQSVIHALKQEHPAITLLLLEQNIGNCKAFNRALALAKGEYIIDFATDDIMMPNRIEKQVAFFSTCEPGVGVVFTDATYIDESGAFMRNHFEYLLNYGLIRRVPNGNIYSTILARYFIPGPAMMVKREVFDKLNGYDETLSFEDFDFWVRSSRYYLYAFLDEKLTAIRKLSNSMSSSWYVPGDKQLMSTYLVCLKARDLNRTQSDHDALIERVRYETRQSIITANHREAALFFALLKEIKGDRLIDQVMMMGSHLHLPLRPLRTFYYKMRYRQ